jgi:hypothetical protein
MSLGPELQSPTASLNTYSLNYGSLDLDFMAQDIFLRKKRFSTFPIAKAKTFFLNC